MPWASSALGHASHALLLSLFVVVLPGVQVAMVHVWPAAQVATVASVLAHARQVVVAPLPLT